MTVHPSGYKVSKFVTCVVKPKENNQCDIETYMISDLIQALERDELFEHSNSQKEMKLKKPKKNEVLPSVYMENRPVELFDPDFAIVNVR